MMTDWPPMDRRGPQLTEAAVSTFEARIGTTLPDDYRAFLLEVNGGRTARSHRVFAIRSNETVLNSLNSMDDPQEQFDLATCWQAERTELPSEVIPAGYDDFGGTVVVVVSGPRRGEVWFLDGADPRPEGANPRVEWFDRRDVSKVADSFREFIAGLRPLDDVAPQRS